MRTVWVFFKLRMRQLRYDKVALVFCYIFPVVLLLGIGYPLELSGNHKIKVSYLETEIAPAGKSLVDALGKQDLVHVVPFVGERGQAESALKNNEIQHLLSVSGSSEGGPANVTIESNSLEENRISAIALASILKANASASPAANLRLQNVQVSRRSSYLATLLPGLIGMTMLVIGLSGFGSVLIGEESAGLFKNLKAIDVSPTPFFAGLFLSRVLVAYSVVAGMLAVSVLGLGVSADINYPLLLLAVTMGATTYLGIGLIVFLFSRSVMAFSGIVSFIQVPMLLLGGAFFSIKLFPSWLQPIAEHSPLAPFTSILRELMFGGVGLRDVSQLYPSLITMSIWMVVILLLARWRFRW
ncbi:MULTISPECIES: ABC transporter permease [Xanthomonas]|jgi:ABC-type multidrug transport system permease subunit|uniref:ABC transporter permease n=1 Tax=Xanthomonas TaxID=338 RepID=UPI001786B888|nr:ABC transporter permease [Xanthomonas surreyensis]MBD7924608.1 ABC transporter permease [Xanthomonas surreyensis]